MERKLTRGLEALLPKHSVGDPKPSGVQTIAMDAVRPNPRQPRHVFDEQGIEELKASIARDGLLQPILVRAVGEGFELIAGERRFRACKALGMQRIAAIVRAVEDDQQLVLALVENLQRRDLNPIDEAQGYRALLEQFAITHDEIAKRVGKERSTITNSMRLLDLPEAVHADVSRGTLSAGHARALLPLVGKARFQSVLERVRAEGLSVRQTEEAVREASARRFDEGDNTRHAQRPLRDAAVRDLEDQLRAVWNTPVRIQVRRRSRAITFECATRAEFDRLVDRLRAAPSRRSERASQLTDDELPD